MKIQTNTMENRVHLKAVPIRQIIPQSRNLKENLNQKSGRKIQISTVSEDLGGRVKNRIVCRIKVTGKRRKGTNELMNGDTMTIVHRNPKKKKKYHLQAKDSDDSSVDSDEDKRRAVSRRTAGVSVSYKEETEDDKTDSEDLLEVEYTETSEPLPAT
ncbi:hypothetical protein BDFB_000964, partial [Asbolus verrucosus]